MNINLTLLGQMITFLLFVWFTKQFVWPPIIKALKERQDKIADGLAAAEKGHLELNLAKEQAQQVLQQGKSQAANLILQANKQSDTIIDLARRQAHEEGQRIITQAHSEVEHLIEQAKENLRQQVSKFALMGAEKILGHSVDASVHQNMLDKLAQEI